MTLCVMGASAQKFENLAMTPPMGWNSWNKFACDVSEQLIMETADAMAASGMKAAGYEYVVIDDCWQVGRDSMGFIVADPVRFPSGIKALADYVHSKGLKFGIYSCAGTETCGGRPGSRGHEFQDAYMYAQWGVDYLKFDWCKTDGQNAVESYRLMSQKLKEAGRPIVFSLCEWGDNKPWNWGKEIGHLWRTTGDIYDCFDCEKNHGTWSNWGVMRILDMQDGLREYAGPGHWNDPDMLEVGNGGLSLNEARAHFSMWCMLAAPLIAGNDLRNMNAETLSILTNADAIAINQDPIGVQGLKVDAVDGLETWVKPLSNGEWAICFLNRSAEPKTISYDWKTKVVKDEFAKRELNGASQQYNIKDVWTKKSLGNTQKTLKATIPSHDVLMVKLSK
ncbi:alpha-galactosidase [Breznakibacter xylanolyticus]|uniref:Alpha-galactosidase n=2 Tax=Breznakibacter xylanolyticus TaxID=990 RepID=A0A2W7NYY5_9BACT|nr:alpha-galactosidase [Breznakibacter xylanolyticus]